MTTAHRPTWHSVTGGKDQGGNRVLVQSRQYSSKDLPGHNVIKYRKSGQGNSDEVTKTDFKAELLQKERESTLQKLKDSDAFSESPEPSNPSSPEKSHSDSDSDSNSNSDFDEEELKQEIEKIKAERAAAEKLKTPAPNPQADPSFSLKRKWTEETIFRNQARDEPKERLRFINDTVRSDFHKKILRKYIQ